LTPSDRPDPSEPRFPLLSPGLLARELRAAEVLIKRIAKAYPAAHQHGLDIEHIARAEDKGSSARGRSDPTGESVANRRRLYVRAKVRRACSEVDRARRALDAALASCREAAEVETQRVDWWQEARRMGRSENFPRTVSKEALDEAEAAQRERRKERDE
jgi:hypothetical protein